MYIRGMYVNICAIYEACTLKTVLYKVVHKDTHTDDKWQLLWAGFGKPKSARTINAIE